MTTALQTRHAGLVNMDLWNVMRDQAAVLVRSGLLPSTVNTPEKAVAIMLKGSELGIPPMYALSNIVVIQGKPTANAELMLALIYRDHGDGAIQFVRSDNQVCTVSYSRRTWSERQTFSFSLDDAKQAGLLSNATWQKYPAAMLRARAISAVARMAFPDSIGGMYTPEELGAAVAVNGDTGEIVIDAQEVPAESTPGRAVGAGERRAPSGPTPSAPARATEEQQRQIRALVGPAGITMDEMLDKLDITSLGDLPAEKAGRVIARLTAQGRERTARAAQAAPDPNSPVADTPRLTAVR